MQVAIIIPALNEGETIANLVAASVPFGQPIVVDDGSSDGTGGLARTAGAIVISHKSPRGYDAALHAGIVDALHRGYEVIATMDGDAQHDPSTLGDLLSALEAPEIEIAIGVRSHGARFAERLFNAYSTVRFRVPDILCGMKAYRAPICERHAPSLDGKTIGTGLALAALRAGARPALVKVPIHPRLHGTARFGGGLRANGRIVRALVAALCADASPTRPQAC